MTSRWPLDVVLGARTSFDALRGDTQMTDKRVAIDVAALRESFEGPQTNSGVRWLPGAQRVADALTKRHRHSVLREVMSLGRWSLRETDEVRVERDRIKELRKAAAQRRKEEEKVTSGPVS